MTPAEYIFNQLATIASTKIEPMFNTNVEVTIIVRVPDNDEADVLVTSDSLDQIRASLDRAERREIL